MKADRGEYRTLFVSFSDDPDAHALSGDAFKCLVMLKLSLSAVGIGVYYPSKLSDQVGCEKPRLEELLDELEAPKPGSDRGWIVRERNVVWIVNALRHEPGLSPTNVKKHVPFVRKLLAQLDARTAIVRRFKLHYAEWFSPDEIAHLKAIDSLSNGIENPLNRPTEETKAGLTVANEKGTDSLSIPSHLHSLSNQDKSGDLEEREPPRNEPEPPAAAPQPEPQQPAPIEWPPEAVDFGRRFYPRGTATDRRRSDVTTQINGVLNGGCAFRGEVVRATADRLAAKCREVLAEGVDKPDRAIVVLLTKLGDLSDDSPTERAAAASKQEFADDSIAIADWLGHHPEDARAIRAKMEKLLRGATPSVIDSCIAGEVRKRMNGLPDLLPHAPTTTGGP